MRDLLVEAWIHNILEGVSIGLASAVIVEVFCFIKRRLT